MFQQYIVDNYAENFKIGNNMPKDKNSGKSILKRSLEWTGYGVLVALLIFMILAQLFPDLKEVVDNHFIQMGLLTGLLAFLLYFDSRISRTEKVRREVYNLSEALYSGFAEMKSGIIRCDSIPNLFEVAMPASNHVKELRIFALSSQKIYEAFHKNDRKYRTDNLLILLLDSDQSRKNIESWKGLTPDRIKKLNCTFYDQRPSSYYVIFDRKFMILGGYYPKNIPSGSQYISPFLIRDSQIIEDYIELHKNTIEFLK